MKRKPKMHNEQEFNLDNVYQEDERQLDNLDDSSFDLRYKMTITKACDIYGVSLNSAWYT